MTPMRKVHNLAFVGILVLVMFIEVAQAETPYDMTLCSSGTVTMVSTSKELTVFSADNKGITISNHPNKIFDNLTYHCVGVVKIEGDKPIGTFYCQFIDPDGDIVVGETTLVGTEGTWKFLQGTGKWKGITGSGKNWPITKGKPITPGTSQSCLRGTGTFELPKQASKD